MVDKKLNEVFNRIDKKTDEFENLPEEEKEKILSIKLNEQIGKTKEKQFIQLRSEVLQFIATRQEDYATERITDYIENNNKIYTTLDDVKSEVWIYDDGIYKPNGESYIKEITRKLLLHAYTPQRSNKVVAKIQADTMIDTDKFFNTMYLNEICVKNGILNLKTRELSDFNSDKIFFNKLPVNYKKDTTCKNIEKFFKEVLRDKEDSKILFELAGFCLHKDYFIEKAFMFLGNGRNGKGKTLGLLKRFLGTENTCSVRLQQMTSESSGLHELHNRMVNMAGDLNNTSLKDTGLFKELTGRDSVQVKRKYLRDLIFTNYAKMIFACNELPKVYDLSEGFWSRWILLEFPYQFLPQNEINQRSKKEQEICKVQDPLILDKLTTEDELSGLLNLAIDGLDRIKKNKDFSYSRGTADVKDYWIRKSDSFTAFCLDNLEDDIDSYISKKDLRKMFNQYCRIHKLKGSSEKNIKVVLENMFGVTDGRRQINGNINYEYAWEGIKIKSCQGNYPFSESLGNVNYSTCGKTLVSLTEDNKLLLKYIKLLSKSNNLIDKKGLEAFEDLEENLNKLKTAGLIDEPKIGFISLL